MFSIVVSLIVGFASLAALWFNYFALAGHDVQGGDGGTAALPDHASLRPGFL